MFRLIRKFLRNNRIGRKHKLLARAIDERLCQFDFVVFDKRCSNLFAFGFQECVHHSSADENAVGAFEKAFDHIDLPADLRAADDGDEWPRGISKDTA